MEKSETAIPEELTHYVRQFDDRPKNGVRFLGLSRASGLRFSEYGVVGKFCI